MRKNINSVGPISLEECTNILKSMQNGKSPGSDGFTVDILKLFSSDIIGNLCVDQLIMLPLLEHYQIFKDSAL